MPKILKTSSKKKEKKYNILTLYLISSLKGILVFTIAFLLMSLFIFKKTTASDSLYFFAFIITALGAFFSGFCAFKKIKGRGFINGIISSGIYAVILLLVISVFMKFNVSVNILSVIPICLISGFLGGTVGANT